MIEGINNLSKKPLCKLSKKSFPETWCNIVKVLEELDALSIDSSKIITCKVGSGSNTLFWLDNWSGEGALGSSFPLLADLKSKKSCLVVDRVTPNGFRWSWKRRTRFPVEL